MTEQGIRQTHLTPDEIEAAAENSSALAESRRGHALACADCAGEVADLRSLSAALASLRVLEPEPGFADRVMARVTLPVPWHRRVAVAVRERTAAGIGVAATFAALLAGAGLWATRFPTLRPATLAAWLASQAGELFWQGAIAAGRVAYTLGMTDLAGALQNELTLTTGIAALATILLVGVGSLSVMIRLVRQEHTELARVR